MVMKSFESHQAAHCRPWPMIVRWLLVPDGLVWVPGIFTRQPLGFAQNGEEEQRRYFVDRITLLIREVHDEKQILTPITNPYSRGGQKSISEHNTTQRTLRRMGYTIRRPRWAPVLSAKNRGVIAWQVTIDNDSCPVMLRYGSFLLTWRVSISNFRPSASSVRNLPPPVFWDHQYHHIKSSSWVTNTQLA